MLWWNKYIGIPFEEKGRTALGTDCWGLVKLVYKIEREIDLPGFEACYDHTNDAARIEAQLEQEWSYNWQHPEEPQPFDIIILRRRGVPMHVGIVTRPGFMLHCERGMDTVHEQYTGMRWKGNIVGFARHG